MLSSKLFKVQQELLAHRLWLRQHAITSAAPRSATCFTPSRTFATTGDRSEAQKTKGTHRKDLPRDARRGNAKGRRPGQKRQHLGYRSPDLGYWQKAIGHSHSSPTAALSIALESPNTFQDAIAAYRELRDKSVTGGGLLWRLTSTLVFRLRVERAKPENEKDVEALRELRQFAGELVRDAKTGTLPPKSKCYTHLLAFYRDDGDFDAVLKLWQWLQKQEPSESYFSPGVYAAVIDTLALKDTPLPEIEDLYKEALTKFPQNFVQYHFSPNAILQNKGRELEFTLPWPLLNAILLARVMRGDTKNAYLALDTTLRLTPTSFQAASFKAMMDERSVAEAYTVFATACRSGTQVGVMHYRRLLTRLRESTGPEAPVEQAVAALRAMVSATYFYVGARGQLTKNIITEIIISVTQLMRLEAVAALPVDERRRLAEQVQGVVRKLISVSARFSAQPGLSAFNSIITNLGGFGQSKEVVSMALADIERLNLQPTLVTCRSILTAAGALKDEAMIKEAWKQLVFAIADEGKYPDTTDAYILIKACVNADVPNLARNALTEMHHLEDYEIERMLDSLEDPSLLGPKEVSKVGTQSFEYLSEGLSKITADIEIFSSRTADPTGMHDFSTQELPMLLISPPSDVALPDVEMRALYEELTTDPASKKTTTAGVSSTPPPATSQTGYTLSELRYQNWKTLTYLLAQADKADGEYFELVDHAIASGRRPPTRHASVVLGAGKGWGVGLSDPVAHGGAESGNVEGMKKRVREVRGLADGGEVTEASGVGGNRADGTAAAMLALDDGAHGTDSLDDGDYGMDDYGMDDYGMGM